MRDLKFLKPVFSLGMLLLVVFLLVVNLLIFKYVPKGTGAVWFILVEEFAVIAAYVFARSFKEPDKVIWWFAKKWWPEENVLIKEDTK